MKRSVLMYCRGKRGFHAEAMFLMGYLVDTSDMWSILQPCPRCCFYAEPETAVLARSQIFLLPGVKCCCCRISSWSKVGMIILLPFSRTPSWILTSSIKFLYESKQLGQLEPSYGHPVITVLVRSLRVESFMVSSLMFCREKKKKLKKKKERKKKRVKKLKKWSLLLNDNISPQTTGKKKKIKE